MSGPFDYNGFAVSKSEPKKSLRTVKKTLLIDSADRDTRKYFTNGDFVVYLPRVYENVVSMRLVAAEFPTLNSEVEASVGITSITAGSGTAVVATGATFTGDYMMIAGSTNTAYDGVYKVSGGSSTTSVTILTTNNKPTKSGAGGRAFPVTLATGGTASSFTHSYASGENVSSSKFTDDPVIASQYYFIVDIDGLNKTDETTVNAQKSTFSDSFFAKIPALSNTYGNVSFIEYNDHSAQENIAKYSPAIGKIDRLRIRTRLHSQQDRSGFFYSTNTGSTGASGTANFNLTLELEMLDNAFDEFSSMETHVRDRS
jgi:hypothetical protein